MLRSLLVLSAALLSVDAQYCAAGPTSQQDSNLGAVTLEGASMTISDTTDCPGQTGAQDKTSEVADLLIGATYSLQYHVTTCGGPYNRASTAWIDYNNDQIFTPDEQLGAVQTTGNVNNQLQTISFTVPAGLAAATTRMRVMVQESSATTLDPCAVYAYGGVKDFGISIITSAPAGSTGALIFLIGVPVAFALYFGIGFGLGHRAGKTGMDRVPHLDFWKEFPSYVSTGCNVTFVFLKGLTNRGGGGESASEKDYEDY